MSRAIRYLTVERSGDGFWFSTGHGRKWLPEEQARWLHPNVTHGDCLALERVSHPCEGAVTLVGRKYGGGRFWLSPRAYLDACSGALQHGLGIRLKRGDVRWYKLVPLA